MAVINIIHGDCMESMKAMPDKAYDLAIVDPPYGQGQGIVNVGNCPVYVKGYEWNEQIPSDKYFSELKRVSLNQIIWGANYFPAVWGCGCKGFVFWDKMQCSDKHADGELAYTSFNKTAKLFRYCFSGNRYGFENSILGVGKKSNRIHPTQKPVALYKWLLKNYAKPGDKILDTHGGSCSIAIACDIMGFDLDCYEIDLDYWTAATERFQRHKRQEVLPL